MGMKCIQCGTDNNLKERRDNVGHCKNCRHQFVFEPVGMTPSFTDAFFAKAIADISANDTLYFTSKQLSYLLCKRINNKYLEFNYDPSSLVAVFLLFVIFLFVIFGQKNSSPVPIIESWAIIGVIFFISMSRLFVRKSQSFALSQEQFQEWLNSWLRVNAIPKLLASPSEESATTPVSSELNAYSFDRAVICDSAEIAQLLIANNFHFENNCAVLSITGYPQSIFSTVMQMLRRNPDLKVYAIHNASPSSVSLAELLCTSPDWFGNSNINIYDLGLLPRQIISKRNFIVQTSEESAQQAKQLPESVRQSLSSAELKWLEAGKFLELESLSPQRIIQILNRGIAKSQDATDSFG